MNIIKSISSSLFSRGTVNVPSSVPDFREIIGLYNPRNPEESLEVIWSRINDGLRRYFEANPGALEKLVTTVNEGGTPAEYERVVSALKEAKEGGIDRGVLEDLAYKVSDAVDSAVYDASIKWRGFGIYFSVKGAITKELVLESM